MCIKRLMLGCLIEVTTNKTLVGMAKRWLLPLNGGWTVCQKIIACHDFHYIYQVERLYFLIKQWVARKLRSIDFLTLNYLCIVETIPYNTWVLNQRTRHASASFVSAQTVMGPAILRATRIWFVLLWNIILKHPLTIVVAYFFVTLSLFLSFFFS